MNEKRLLLWVRDLESGTRQQTKGELHRRSDGVDRYCCLGVLCEVALSDGLNIDVLEVPMVGNDVSRSYDNTGGYEPDAVDDWLDVDTTEIRQYADMNDNGANFIDIAAKIRADFNIQHQED